nr:hypothetical protein [Clostridia bacterium]
MNIDIIDYTEEQLAALTVEKLQEVRNAQGKKDTLAAKLAKRLVEEKQSLIDKGAYPSDIFGKIEKKLQKEYEDEVQRIRDSLIFFLHYVADNNGGDVSAPYVVNYALSEAERALIVKDYYNATYSDKIERFQAFKADDFVKVYTGELYRSLYSYFYVDVDVD